MCCVLCEDKTAEVKRPAVSEGHTACRLGWWCVQGPCVFCVHCKHTQKTTSSDTDLLLCVCFPSLQEVGEEEEGNSELQTGNDSDGQQLPTHNHGGHAHAERTQ